MNLSHIRFEGRASSHAGPGLPGRLRSGDVRPTVEPWPAPSPGGLAATILSRAGLDPSVYRDAPLSRRTQACIRAVRADSAETARQRLETRPELMPPALSSLLIGVSGFFRDPPVWETLRTDVLPALAARGGPLRVLSVGCSFGAELYSVGMLLADAALLDRATLVGIDCRADAVEQARAGVFEGHAAGWPIEERLRERTAWLVMDATRGLPAAWPPWDLILCRNLFIYLQPAAADDLARRLVERLVPGGVLVLGKAELPPAGLGLRTVARCVHRLHD